MLFSKLYNPINSTSLTGDTKVTSVWKKSDTNPTTADVPLQLGDMWVNYSTGEIFVCTKINAGGTAEWVGQSTITKAVGDVSVSDPFVPDVFGDNSAVAFYKLNGNAKDECGVYHGVWYGDEMYDVGVNGGYCGYFNGNSAIKLNYNFSTVKSISLWFNYEGSGYSTILGSKTINTTYNNMKLLVFSGVMELGSFHNNTFQSICSVEHNKWYFVVINEISSGVYSYYVNGQLVAYNLPDNNATLDILYIASDNNDGVLGAYFKGKLDNIRFFNRPLSNLQVQALYNLEKPIS